MIVTERYPQKSLYYLGGELLRFLNNNNIKYSLLELYRYFKKDTKVELKKFILLLDWLYIIDKIKITEDGYIVKCS